MKRLIFRDVVFAFPAGYLDFMILLFGDLDFIDPCAMWFACTVCYAWNKNSLQLGSGSPMMNRMEGGGDTGAERDPGVAGNSPTGAAMQGNTQQAAVGTAMTTPAQSLIGQAGSLVGTGVHILPPAQNIFGTYGPMRCGLWTVRITV